MSYPALFPSFILGGFEGSNFIDRSHRRADYITLTQHDRFYRQDYERARAAGMRIVREVARWPLCDRAGAIDLSSYAPMALAAHECGLAHILCLFHYGYPDDLHPFDDRFVPRFVAFAEAVALWRARHIQGPRWYAVANEISFYAFAAGDMGWFGPHLVGSGARLKRILIAASLRATEAIQAIDPEARFIAVDPIRYEVPPRDRPDLAEQIARENETEHEARDIALGRAEPQLGGWPESFQVVGVNCYPDTQRVTMAEEGLPIDDPRRLPLRQALGALWERYRKPIIMAETSARDAQRPFWLRYVTDEVIAALKAGVDVQGVCIYPLVDMREWKRGQIGEWGRLGLWDIREADGVVQRVENPGYLRALAETRARLEASGLLPRPIAASEPPLRQKHASRDAEDVSRDVARILRGEEDVHRSELGGLRRPADRSRAAERLHVLDGH